MTLKELRDARHKLVVEMKAMNALAEKDNRPFSDEERTKWNQLVEHQGQLDERIKSATLLATATDGQDPAVIEQRDREEFEARKRINQQDDPNRPLTQWERCQAFTAWAMGSMCTDPVAKQLAVRAGYPLGQSKVEWQLDLGRSPDGMPLKPARNLDEVRHNAQQRREFRQVERERYEVERERYERERETRAQGVASGGVGLFVVPDEMMAALEESLLAWGGMRQVSTVISSATGADLPIPMVNDTAQKGVILAENTGAAEQDVTFTQKVMKAFKYSSKMIKVSVELLQDSSINLPQFLGSALGTRIGRITNDHFTTGGGTTEPWGVVARAGDSSVTVATANTIIFSEPLRLLHSVDPAYRTGASFMGNDSTILKLRSMVDGQARPVWEPSLQPMQPGSLYGYPVVTNQSMAAYAAAAKVLLFGQFSKYLIRDVRGIEILQLNERFAEAHQVAFLGFSRHDGDLLDSGTDPVKYMTGT